ncbi:TatD family hydrolase [Pseudoalteromonas aurantia]|uniref:TatD DNase family protein n=1 Tax=Pseudoalteromonas aurantia 208 TaxID=1314867 RepID=A0ABR9EEQ1_9GAMM|nr:TatD family hydrolase [Pseudoalteromonas aurantia]MBE0369463.1 TatD DNase family protein [Pseudoalteromonas aurantia 208]
MRFIDSHCHLDFPELSSDLARYITNANAVGVCGFVIPGVSLAQSQKLLTFKQEHAGCYIAVGLHPYFITQHQSHHFDALAQYAHEHQGDLVAIGECGIDATCEQLTYQQSLFQQHIQLANALKLPLIIHHRQSHHYIAQAFKQTPPLYGGVIHAFSGSLQQANYYIAKGFKLGVGGTISYERANKTKAVFATVALQHLLLETDSPSMPLFGHQGQINLPERVVDVFKYLCQLRHETPSDIAQQLYDSSCTLFRI